MPSIGELVGTVTLEDRFSSALEKVADTAKEKLHEIESTFASLTLGVAAVGAAIVGMTGTIIAMGVAGSHLNDIENGFNRAAKSAENATGIFDAMNKALHGALDDDFIRQFATKGLTTGAMKTAEDFKTIGEAARSLSHDGFGSVEQMLGTISNALTTGRTRSLQFLTGVIDLKSAEKEYAASLGVTVKELSAQGKLHADQIAIYAKLRDRIKETGDVETTFAEKVSAANVALENWFEGIQQAVAASPKVNKMLDDIGAALMKAFGGTATTAAEAIVEWIDKFADAVGYYGPIIIQWMADVIDRVQEIWTSVRNAWDLVPDWFKNIARDAAGAAIAVALVNKALSAPMGGGSSTLGDAASVATLVSGFQSLAVIVTKTAEKFNEFLKIVVAMPVVGGGLIGYLKNWGVALGEVTTIFLASPLGKASLWTLAAYGIYKVGDAFHEMYKAWRDTSSMWTYFEKNGSFWDNSIVGRMLGMSKPKEEKLPGLSTPNLQRVPTLFSNPIADALKAGDNSGDTIEANHKALMAKIASATKHGLDEARNLWQDYYKSVEVYGQVNLDTMLRDENAIYEDKKAKLREYSFSEKNALGKSIQLNNEYQEDLYALDTLHAQNRLNIQKKFWLDFLAAIPGQIAQPFNADLDRRYKEIHGDGLNGLLPMAALTPRNLPLGGTEAGAGGSSLIPGLNQAAAAAFKLDQVLNKLFTENVKAAQPLNAEMTAGIRNLASMGMTAEEIAKDLGLPFEQVRRAIGNTIPLVQELKKDLSGFGDVMVAALEGGGDVGGTLKAFGSKIGGDIGKHAGKALEDFGSKIGGSMGKMLGSVAQFLGPLGSLLGPAIEKVFNVFTHAEEKAVNKTREDFVQTFGKGALGLQNLSKAAVEATGSLTLVNNLLRAKTVDDYKKALDALNDALAKAKELEDKRAQATEMRLSFADKLLSNLDAMTAALGEQTDAWDELQKQIDGATKGSKEYNDLVAKQKGTITATKDDLDALGSIAVASFAAAQAAGKNFADSLDAAGPALSRIYKGFTDLGIPIDNAALKMLAFQGQMLQNNPALMHGVSALADSLKILDAMGMLNKDTFLDMEHTIGSMFAKMQGEAAKGGGSIVDIQRNALIPMQDALHAAEKAAKDLGVPLDENTQMLIDQSKELGIWKDQGKTQTDIMIDAFKELNKTIDDLARALRGLPPRVDSEVVVTTTHQDDGSGANVPDIPSGPNNGEGDRVPGNGSGNREEALGGVGYAAGPMTFTTKGNEQYAFSSEGKSFRQVIEEALAGGGRGAININNQFDMSGVLTDSDFAALIETKAMPVVVRQIQNNTNGVRTTIKEDLGVS